MSLTLLIVCAALTAVPCKRVFRAPANRPIQFRWSFWALMGPRILPVTVVVQTAPGKATPCSACRCVQVAMPIAVPQSRHSRVFAATGTNAGGHNVRALYACAPLACTSPCICRYVGIIDFLQQWNLQKRAERNWKVAVSCCSPWVAECAHSMNQVYMRRVDPDGVSAMVMSHL